jgi:hypothetical protein
MTIIFKVVAPSNICNIQITKIMQFFVFLCNLNVKCTSIENESMQVVEGREPNAGRKRAKLITPLKVIAFAAKDADL